MERLLVLLNDESVDEAVCFLGDTLGCAEAILYGKHFLSSERFQLHVIAGARQADGKESSSILPPNHFADEHWKTLEEGETLFFPERPSGDPPSPVDGTLVVPLFLHDDLFGILSLASLPPDRTKYREEFLSAVRGALEMWVERYSHEKRFKDFLNVFPNPTFIISAKGEVTAWNKSVEELTCCKAEQMIGKGNYEHSIPFYNERRPNVSNLLLDPDSGWEKTYVSFRREGDDAYVLAYCPSLPGGGAYLNGKTSLLHGLDGRVWGAIHTVRDVTRERRIERELHHSESMYRTMTEFAGVGIMLLSQDKVLYLNEKFRHHTGLPAGEITFPRFMDWILPEDREGVAGHFEDLFRGRTQTSRFEFRVIRSGPPRYYRGYARVIEYVERPTVHFVLDDVTEQKELARKARLNELRLYHDDRLTALGIMAAGIAHELNQPLNTIRVVTEGMLFGMDLGWTLDNEELSDSLEMVSRQVVRMSEVIKNIRNFAREDRITTVGDVNVNIAVENVFSMIGRQLETHGIIVSRELPPDLPGIKANLNRFEQVIMNLIVNARQELDDKQREHKEIWVRSGTRNGSVYVEVGDNGKGIPKDVIGKIFDPFFTTKEVGKGTGLGLSISQSIMAEFKGRIEVFNNEHGGATFMVMAPASTSSVRH